MKNPNRSPYFGALKVVGVPITHDLEIVNQGTIPYKRQEGAPVSPAPKGRQKARGFGLQMRPTEYIVR